MLTFTVDDWDDAQTVTVTAEEDDDGVTDAVATLTHTASGGDYANVTRDLPVTVTENDTAGVTIEPTVLSVVAGRSNEYTVKLATQPTGEVTVTISGHASTDVSLSGPTLSSDTLTFTVDDWSMAQTVTVSAAENAATGKVTLAHAVAGADYASVTAEPVVVSVVAVAGQHPTIQVGVSSSTQTLTVPEGGSNFVHPGPGLPANGRRGRRRDPSRGHGPDAEQRHPADLHGTFERLGHGADGDRYGGGGR